MQAKCTNIRVATLHYCILFAVSTGSFFYYCFVTVEILEMRFCQVVFISNTGIISL